MSPRTFPYVVVDVFTSRPLEGNPLAVFTDARAMSAAEMQKVAKETNLSETTFILPGETNEADTHRVRIFTVAEELPFAGHPTLGTALVLRANAAHRPPRIVLDLKVGRIPVTFRDDAEGTFGEMRQRDPEFGALHTREDVARATGISLDDIADDVPIQMVSTGVAFTMVPLRTLAAARRLRVDQQGAREYLEKSNGKFFYFVTRETELPDARLHARMLFYGGEDPATGSAAGCCAAWAARHGVVPSGATALIEQGIEIERPSRIFIRATRQGDTVTDVHVGGYAVTVARGEMSF